MTKLYAAAVEVFDQPIANAAVVVIDHDLGRRRLVQVYDSDGELVCTDIRQTLSRVTITFATAFTGRVLVV